MDFNLINFPMFLAKQAQQQQYQKPLHTESNEQHKKQHTFMTFLCAHPTIALASSCSSTIRKKKVQSALLLITDVKMILGDRIENDAGNEHTKNPVEGKNGNEEEQKCNKKKNNNCMANECTSWHLIVRFFLSMKFVFCECTSFNRIDTRREERKKERATR